MPAEKEQLPEHQPDNPVAPGESHLPISETRESVRNLLSVTVPEDALKKARQALYSAGTETKRTLIFKQYGKEWGMTPEEARRAIARYETARIQKSERGGEAPIRHYHRTTLGALALIAKDGRFLSRSLVKKLHPEFPLQGWSASDDVLFTRDAFHDGKLRRRGFDPSHTHGASGDGAVFVMKESMMDNETYDPTAAYPSASDLPIVDHCECILAKDETNRAQILDAIRGTSLASIPVRLFSEWKL